MLWFQSVCSWSAQAYEINLTSTAYNANTYGRDGVFGSGRVYKQDRIHSEQIPRFFKYEIYFQVPPSVVPFKHPWLGPFGITYNVFSFVTWPHIYNFLCNSVICTVAVAHNCSNLFYWSIWLYKQTLLTAVLCTKVAPTDWTLGAQFAEGEGCLCTTTPKPIPRSSQSPNR